MIKELCAGADHNDLWNGVDLRLHLEVVLTLQVDQENSEICAAQVQSQKLPLLYNVRMNC